MKQPKMPVNTTDKSLEQALNKVAIAPEGILLKIFIELTILTVYNTFVKGFLSSTLQDTAEEKLIQFKTIPLKVTTEELIIPEIPVIYDPAAILGLKSYISVLFYETIESPITTTFHRCLFRLELQKITPAQCNIAFLELITHATLVKGAYNTLCKMESVTVYEIYKLWENCCSCLQRMLEYFENFEKSINVSELTTYYNNTTNNVEEYCNSLPDCSASSFFLKQTEALNLQYPIQPSAAIGASIWCKMNSDNKCSYLPHIKRPRLKSSRKQESNSIWNRVRTAAATAVAAFKNPTKFEPLSESYSQFIKPEELQAANNAVEKFERTRWAKDIKSVNGHLHRAQIILGLNFITDPDDRRNFENWWKINGSDSHATINLIRKKKGLQAINWETYSDVVP